MQAEKAAGSPLPEPPDELDPFVLVVVVPIRATPPPEADEPPQPEARSAEPAAARTRVTIEVFLPLQQLRRGRRALLGFMSITPCLIGRNSLLDG
jgi:hypothetical protein